MRDAATGKRKRKWHRLRETVKGQREAETERAKLIALLSGDTYVEPNKMTVAVFLERWLDHMKTQVAPRSHERYAEIARKNVVPLLGAVRLNKLQPEQIAQGYATALASGRRDGAGGLSPRTVHHMHRVLKQALEQAVKWGSYGLLRNPAAAVAPPKVARAMMQTYDIGQTVQLLNETKGKRLHVPVLLAVLCGLRRGEIAALRWRSVDLGAAQLAVVQSAEQTLAGVRYKEPKSGRGRTVALSATVVAELRAHRAAQAQELLRVGKRLSDDDFVVTQADGAPLRPHSLGQEWVRFLANNGALPRIRFHDLRHAHATHLLAAGVHPKVASERLGHSKIGITLDLYSHVLPNMQAYAAALVDDALQIAIQKQGSKGVR